MLAVNYKNLLTKIYPEIPKIFNLETAVYLYNATVANVSVATFFIPKGTNFVPSEYLIGIEVDDFNQIPTRQEKGFTITDPVRTLQDLFTYKEYVDYQVLFDYVSGFAIYHEKDPCAFLDEKTHREVKQIEEEGWSHGN